MFFIEPQLLQNKETIIPNSFFELVLPMLASAPYAVSVYLFGYYKSLNQDGYGEEIKTNEELANKLGITLDEVYRSWQICEELGLIEKQVIDNELTGNYAIRFRDLRTIGSSQKSKEINPDELLVAYQADEYKKMYDQIEQALKYPLSSQDIKKIHHTLKDFNINKNLAVEAVLYTLYKKNNRSIAMAMGVLRNWHLDGIRTVEDLEQMLQGKEKRYVEYKKILGAMGEYRGPTDPEKILMDIWLDEYLFDLDAIIDAISKTTAIKSPNLNYVDGILKNRLKGIQQAREKNPQLLELETRQIESNFEKRQKILEAIEFSRKTLRKDEMRDLESLASNFDVSDVEVTYKFLRKNNRDSSLASILMTLNGETAQPKRQQKITLQQVKIAEEQNRLQGQNQQIKQGAKIHEKKESRILTENKDREIGPLEKRLQQKRIEQLKKDGKL